MSEQALAQAVVAAMRPGQVDVEAAAAALDEMAEDERVAAVRAWSRAQQAELFEAAAGRRVTLADIVPAGTPPLVPIICEGKNSLVAFTHFQKRFCRSPVNPEGELYGYNHQSMSWLTGPGYFVARQGGDEIIIDYTVQPTARPDSWPPLASNDGFPGRLAFGGLVDLLRRVSEHVTIGRATRRGATLDNWFALVARRPVSASGA